MLRMCGRLSIPRGRRCVRGPTGRWRRRPTASPAKAPWTSWLTPDHLKNQIEGAAVMGLGGAIFEAIQFDNGKIKNPHFSKYRVPRFHDAPTVEAVLLDRKDAPSAGAGETPIIAVAPAIGNAI